MDRFLNKQYLSIYFIIFVASALVKAYLSYDGNYYFENSFYFNYGALVVQNLFLLYLYKKYSAIKEVRQSVLIRIKENRFHLAIIKFWIADIVLFFVFSYGLILVFSPLGIFNIALSAFLVFVWTILFALIEGLFVYFVFNDVSQYYLLAGFVINFSFHYFVIVHI